MNSVEVPNFSGFSTQLLKLRATVRMKASLEYLLFEQKKSKSDVTAVQCVSCSRRESNPGFATKQTGYDFHVSVGLVLSCFGGFSPNLSNVTVKAP